MFNISENYEKLWKAIIRPPRAIYQKEDVGTYSVIFRACYFPKKRNEDKTNISLANKQERTKVSRQSLLTLQQALQDAPMCNISSRQQQLPTGSVLSFYQHSQNCLTSILCHDVSLFAFDFAGCGNSGGEYISLGYHEREDVDVVFNYLRSLDSVSSIGIWGRSMGAVTALMYADRNHQIGCLVLDSPFSNLQVLCKQLAKRFVSNLSAFSGIALTFLSKTIKEKVHSCQIRIISKSNRQTHQKMSVKPSFQRFSLQPKTMTLSCLTTPISFMKNIQERSKKYQLKVIIIQEDSKMCLTKYQVFSISAYVLKISWHLTQLSSKNKRKIKNQKIQSKMKKQKDLCFMRPIFRRKSIMLSKSKSQQRLCSSRQLSLAKNKVRKKNKRSNEMILKFTQKYIQIIQQPISNMESSRLRSSFVYTFCLLITGLAQDSIIQASTPQQHESTSWQKVCMILGIILVGIAAIIYGLRRRNLNVGELLRGYVVTSQAQVTFVNFKNQNQRGAEVVMETSHTIDKSTSFQDDNNYLSKDQQLSIDQGGDTENRQLSSVFQRKQGTKIKKSKTRKRLANVAKVSQNANEDENSQISQDSDL